MAVTGLGPSSIFNLAKENIVSCSTIVVIGAIVLVLLFLAGCDPISRYEREERRFRRWKEKQERENHVSPPDDE